MDEKSPIKIVNGKKYFCYEKEPAEIQGSTEYIVAETERRTRDRDKEHDLGDLGPERLDDL